MTRLLPAVVAALIGAPGFAADLSVPSQYPTIQAAIDAASDWDRISVEAGSYPEALRIESTRLELRAVPAGGRVAIHSLRVEDSSLATVSGFDADSSITVAASGIRLSECSALGGVSCEDASPVVAERVVARGPALLLSPGMNLLRCASVQLDSCELTGSFSSRAEFSDSVTTTGAGLRVDSCRAVLAAGCVLKGGNGAAAATGYGGINGGAGLLALNDSRVTLLETTTRGGDGDVAPCDPGTPWLCGGAADGGAATVMQAGSVLLVDPSPCDAPRPISGHTGDDAQPNGVLAGFPSATCAPVAGGPAALWRFTVPQPGGRVELSARLAQGQADEFTLSLRADCGDPSSQVACVFGPSRGLLVFPWLAPGCYTLAAETLFQHTVYVSWSSSLALSPVCSCSSPLATPTPTATPAPTLTPSPSPSPTPTPSEACASRRGITGASGTDSQSNAVHAGFARSSCAPSPNEPTALWCFTMPEPGGSIAFTAVPSDAAGDELSLSLRRNCDDAATEVACHFPTGPLSVEWLPPGDYTVVSEGLFPHTMVLTWDSSVALQSNCLGSVDTDGDGFSDAFETREGSNPEDPASLPAALDLNGDGNVDSEDGLLLYRNRIGATGVIGGTR